MILAFSVMEQRTSACTWELLDIQNIDAGHAVTSALRDFGARINMFGAVGEASNLQLRKDHQKLVSALRWINGERNDLLHAEHQALFPAYVFPERVSESSDLIDYTTLLRIRTKVDNAVLRRKLILFPAPYLISLAEYALTIKDALAAFTVNFHGMHTSYRLEPPQLDARPQRHLPDRSDPK